MKIIKNPPFEEWEKLTLRAADNTHNIDKEVMEIIKQVRRCGDNALITYSEKFDRVALDSLFVEKEYLWSSKESVPGELREAISVAASNLEKFHRAQLPAEIDLVTYPGVRCLRRSFPIEKVGLYIPGGGAPLFSTVLMLLIPAQIAGCKEITLFTPPNADGTINPIIAYTASLLGVEKIVKVGGAQAIAAMAYGTDSIGKVDKIFGPGNQYVTTAKQIVSKDVAIDMPAGPSELMVIADSTAVPKYIAADLLSQAEHGIDSQVVLLTQDSNLLSKVLEELERQKEALPRRREIDSSLSQSFAILFDRADYMVGFANCYAPEHLIIATERPWELSKEIRAAGSIFIGNYSPESAGDYTSGTNHTLPTNGWAKSISGLGVESFMHQITYQELTKEGFKNLGQTISVMAKHESLQAHKNAVDIRLKDLNN